MKRIIDAGPVPWDSDDYVERNLDTEVLDHILAREYVNLLGGRQTGKSSMVFHLQTLLFNSSHPSSYVNFQLIEGHLGIAEWYQRFFANFLENLTLVDASSIPRDGITSDASGFRKLVYETAALLPPDKLLVIFLDEVTAVPDKEDIKENLFNTIRAMYGDKASQQSPRGAQQTVFAFAGSFDPQRLIVGPNSPFNVAHSCYFTRNDFTSSQVDAIAARFGVESQAASIYSWTSGHPYLTHRIIRHLLAGMDIEAAVKQILSDDGHMGYIIRELENGSEAVRALALTITSDAKPDYSMGPKAFDTLVTIGLINEENQKAVIRCKLYQERIIQFAKSTASLAAPVKVVVSPLAFVQDTNFRKYLESNLDLANDLVESNPVMAIVCAGVVIEGCLTEEFQTNVTPAQKTAGVNSYNSTRSQRDKLSPTSNPISWTFFQLIEIAALSNILDTQFAKTTHVLRDWRNYIHPSKARSELADTSLLEKAGFAISASVYVIAQIRKRHPTI